MTTDPLTLVNLACLKHTGCLLPVSCNGSPEWSYELVDGKKKGKYNPYKSTLLRNPFVTAYDTHPIEQQIKRSMIVGEIKEIFKPDIRYIDILMALGGRPSDDNPIPLDERRDLRMIGINYLLWLMDDSGVTTEGMRPLAKIIDAIHTGDYRYDGSETNFNSVVLNTLIFQNQDRLPKTFQLLRKKNNPSKIKEKVLKAHNRLHKKAVVRRQREAMGASCLNQGVTTIDLHIRKDYRSQSVLELYTYSTNMSYPKVKKDDWWCWFYLYFNCQDYCVLTLPEVHQKRSNTKVNWWGEVKKQSGLYSPPAHQVIKSGYEKRLMESILKQ